MNDTDKHMDSIDQAQQREIEGLKRKDIAHDWGIRVMFLVVILMVIGTFAFLMESLSRASAYNCPHKDCVHHRGMK